MKNNSIDQQKLNRLKWLEQTIHIINNQNRNTPSSSYYSRNNNIIRLILWGIIRKKSEFYLLNVNSTMTMFWKMDITRLLFSLDISNVQCIESWLEICTNSKWKLLLKQHRLIIIYLADNNKSCNLIIRKYLK